MGSYYGKKSCNVLVVDTQPVIRYGVKSILMEKMCDPWEVHLATAADATDAIRRLTVASIDVVILGDYVQIGGTPDLIRQMILQDPTLRVLVLGDKFSAKQVKEAIDAGAKGYIKKNISATELVDAVIKVYGRFTYFSSSVADLLLQEERFKYNVLQRTPVPLTQRELEVLRLIVLGLPNNKICGILGIGVRTVDTHRKNLLRKTEAKNAAGLVRIAMELNLLQDAKM